MKPTEKTAMQLIEELAAHRNQQEKDLQQAKQREAEAKLQDNLDFWKPVHDILMEAAATYPSKIIVNLCTLTSHTRWHAVRDGANSGFHLARFTSRVAVGDKYKTRASGTVPADLIPEVMNILADIIRK